MVNFLKDLTWSENDEISRAIYTLNLLSLIQRAKSYGYTKSDLIEQIAKAKSTDKKEAKSILSERVNHYVDSAYRNEDAFIKYIVTGVPPTL